MRSVILCGIKYRQYLYVKLYDLTEKGLASTHMSIEPSKIDINKKWVVYLQTF